MAVATAPQAAATTRQPKGWLATLVVAALMVLIVGAGFVTANAVETRPQIGVRVGNDAYVYPDNGWEFAGRSEDGNTVLLTNGSGSLAITAFPQCAPILPAHFGDELDAKRAEWLATGTVTATEPEPVDVGPYSGRRFTYSGTFEDVPLPVEGEVTGISAGCNVVLFDGWSGVGQYSTVADDIDELITTAVIR